MVRVEVVVIMAVALLFSAQATENNIAQSDKFFDCYKECYKKCHLWIKVLCVRRCVNRCNPLPPSPAARLAVNRRIIGGA
ncbi:hypothetical protein ACP275_09G079900 [Erythranthe tilingii]